MHHCGSPFDLFASGAPDLFVSYASGMQQHALTLYLPAISTQSVPAINVFTTLRNRYFAMSQVRSRMTFDLHDAQLNFGEGNNSRQSTIIFISSMLTVWILKCEIDHYLNLYPPGASCRLLPDRTKSHI